MGARRDTFQKVGREVLGHQSTPAERRLVDAFAAMLEQAVVALDRHKPGPKPRATPDPSQLPFTPKAVFDALEEHCSHIVQLYPYEKSSFGRFGKTLQGIEGLEAADFPRVISWIGAGGLNTWPVQVTWAHVIKHFANWVQYARAWEEKSGGSQPSDAGTDAWR